LKVDTVEFSFKDHFQDWQKVVTMVNQLVGS